MKLEKFIYCYALFLIVALTLGGFVFVAYLAQHWAPLAIGGLALPLLVGHLYLEYKS